MKRRRLIVVLVAAIATIGLSTPAYAATVGEKLEVLSTWSQSTTASYNAWNAARQNQGSWTSYGFDWSTDYCSSSPDQPLGFDFRIPCWHHDFGYRNYKAVGRFPANKDRIDNYFYFDLKNKCATYNRFVRPACLSLAWTYYQAVHTFGNLKVSQKDLDKAQKLKDRAS